MPAEHSGQVPPPPDDVVTRFEDAILAAKQVRIDRQLLWTLWTQADAAWAGSWAARPRLADALYRLAATGSVELPAPRGRLWDRAIPALPLRIHAPANRRPPSGALDPATEPWAPAMKWAPKWIRAARPPQQLRVAAVQLNRWLLATTGQQPPRVARDERSLHIFDDEKRLAALTGGPLFADDRLTLDDLACDPPVGGLRIARITQRGPALVVENKSTFDSAWRVLRTTPAPPYAAVVFGSGDAAETFTGDLSSLPELIGVTATRFDYAGDVDIAGVEAAAAFATAAQSAGLEVAMATPLWDAVAHANPTGPDLTAEPAQTNAALQIAADLGLPAKVIDRLRNGIRIPQERIDRVALADLTWWAPSS